MSTYDVDFQEATIWKRMRLMQVSDVAQEMGFSVFLIDRVFHYGDFAWLHVANDITPVRQWSTMFRSKEPVARDWLVGQTWFATEIGVEMFDKVTFLAQHLSRYDQIALWEKWTEDEVDQCLLDNGWDAERNLSRGNFKWMVGQ